MKNISKVIFSLVVLFICIGCIPKDEQYILVTSQLTGEVTPCKSCPQAISGGGASWDKYINYWRIKYPKGLILSPGNLFSYTADGSTDSLISASIPNYMFDAVAIGWLEFIEGDEYFINYVHNSNTPWVNCNLMHKGEHIGNRHLTFKKSDITIGVVSAVSELNIKGPLLKNKVKSIEVLPAVSSLIKEINSIKDSVDYIVVLSHLLKKDEREFAEIYKSDKSIILLSANPCLECSKQGFIGKLFWEQLDDRGQNMLEMVVNRKSGILRKTYHDFNREEAGVLTHQNTRQDKSLNSSLKEQNKYYDALKVIGERNSGKDTITIYYSPACHDCHELIGNKLLKLIKERNVYAEMIDISIAENYNILMKKQTTLGIMTKEIPVALYHNNLYDGSNEINLRLFKDIFNIY